MTKRIIVALLPGVLLVNGLSAQRQSSVKRSQVNARSRKPVKVQYGIASFYANKFNGRKTANGEIFSQKKLTAASNTLPLDTWVKVTNLHNKKMVIVRITDRMHKRNTRLIDLSKASARQLGYTGRGLTRVKVEVIPKRRKAMEEVEAANP